MEIKDDCMMNMASHKRTWSKLGEQGNHGEHGEHGKGDKHQTGDLKGSISDTLFVEYMTQNILVYSL